LVIALMLAVVGFILYVADKKSKKVKDLKNISREDAIWIGVSQALAIIPGVSRSGATMTAGLFCSLDRVSVARFSFLLSTPIILGAAVFKIPHLIQGGITVPIIIGIITSAVSGYLAIKYLLKFVEKSSYAVFFWYRLALAFLIVFVYYLK
jgi:undecaprenyl-diphosphatase